MKTISQDASRQELVSRLARLAPAAERRWGSLTAAEMLCHLGDTFDSVLGIRIPPGPPPSGQPKSLLKWMILYAPIPWPKGVTTRPGVNPHLEGTRPGVFDEDRLRVLRGLEQLASAPAEQLSPHHFLVGPMTRTDWQRWAYKHADHHLRQFGL